MEVSVSAALGHMKKFMHPQAVITDDRSREDAFFTTAMRAKTFQLGKPVIELPVDASESLMWIARLDSSSLAGNLSDQPLSARLLTVFQLGIRPTSTSSSTPLHIRPDRFYGSLNLSKRRTTSAIVGLISP